MPKKILLVDDDTELAEELAEILRDAGYPVDSTSDSAQGERLIKENTYEVYLFDYKMSGLSGADLLRIAKKKNPQSAIFIISGRPAIDKLLKEERILHLVSAVIKKPFDVESLLQKLQALP